MADKKKQSDKQGRNAKSKQGMAYVATFKRYTNAMKRVKRHVKKYPDDQKAKKWLEFLSTTLAMDYKRGNAAIQKKHESLHAGG